VDILMPLIGVASLLVAIVGYYRRRSKDRQRYKAMQEQRERDKRMHRQESSARIRRRRRVKRW
jgi:hypothetical protein